MNTIEKSFIKNIVQSNQWSVIEQLGRALIDKIKEEGTIGDTEWETVKTALLKEGKAEGIRMFLSELFLIGSKND